MEFTLVSTVLLPLGLGFLGFLEPCSIGATLVFLKSVEGNPAHIKVAQAAVLMLTRAIFIGALGALAGFVGTAFLQFQRAGYILLGALYLVLGIVYLAGQASRLVRTFGPSLTHLSTVRGSAALAVFFGFNVPACSLPLLAAVLGSAAIAGAAKIGQAFAMLALFGLGLSLPVFLALAFGPTQRVLERLADYSRRAPLIIGLLFVVLGAWSIYFGVAARWAKV
jgi:cytochrome c-type biogenesis protein